MYKTFEELERIAYMSNLPEIAKLYAQLDDNEQIEIDFQDLRDRMRDLEYDSEYTELRAERAEDKVEELEKKLEKIAAIITYD
jgi:predicted nuclease with TOPRIM domain